MAIVLNNLITKGLSGQLGKALVFRKVGDRTIVATAPSTNADPTEPQKLQRERFKRAAIDVSPGVLSTLLAPRADA